MSEAPNTEENSAAPKISLIRKSGNRSSSSAERQEQSEKLGKRLQEARLQKGLEIDDLRRQTKISRRNLMAMEANNYYDMPAFSFSRGFYKMYANAVGLDTENIIYQFELEYNKYKKDNKIKTFDIDSLDRDVNAMAGRPSLISLSSFGFILLILLFFGGFLCWFFSWNPAGFLSQQLRNLTPHSRYEIPVSAVHIEKEMHRSHKTGESRAALC